MSCRGSVGRLHVPPYCSVADRLACSSPIRRENRRASLATPCACAAGCSPAFLFCNPHTLRIAEPRVPFLHCNVRGGVKASPPVACLLLLRNLFCVQTAPYLKNIAEREWA